jgi:hypothetical protein
MRKQTRHKTKTDFIMTQEWYNFYSALFNEERTEFIENEVRENEETELTVSETDVHFIIGKVKMAKHQDQGILIYN